MGNSTSRIPRELSSAQHSTTNCHCIFMNSNSIWLRQISLNFFKLIYRSQAHDHWNLLKKQLCLLTLNYCFEILFSYLFYAWSPLGVLPCPTRRNQVPLNRECVSSCIEANWSKLKQAKIFLSICDWSQLNWINWTDRE